MKSLPTTEKVCMRDYPAAAGLISELRSRDFDLAISFRMPSKQPCCMVGPGIAKRIGYGATASLLLTARNPDRPRGKAGHAVYYYLGCWEERDWAEPRPWGGFNAPSCDLAVGI